VIREMPVDGEVENHLSDLIKHFLIENAYYALAERYIQRIIFEQIGEFGSQRNQGPGNRRFHPGRDWKKKD